MFWSRVPLYFLEIKKKLTPHISETDQTITEKLYIWGLGAETNMYAKFH